MTQALAGVGLAFCALILSIILVEIEKDKPRA